MSRRSEVSRIEELRAEIASVFGGTKYPGDASIATQEKEYSDYEGNSIAEFLRGKRWQDITHETLRNDYSGDHSALLHFLTDEGFRYYLPAFLTIAVDAQQAAELADSLASALTFESASGIEAKFNDRVGMLSEPQKKVVIAVLKSLAAHYDKSGYPDNPARSALDSILSKLKQST